MTAYHTVVLTKKIISTGKPSYIAQRMTKLGGVDLRYNKGKVMVQKRKLAISREGFIYRAAVLYNAIDEDLRSEENVERFKSGLRKWVSENISVKQSSKFPRIASRRISRNTDDVNIIGRHDIRRFLIDRSSVPAVLVPTPTDRPPPVPARLVPTDNSSRNQGILKYFTSKEHRK